MNHGKSLFFFHKPALAMNAVPAKHMAPQIQAEETSPAWLCALKMFTVSPWASLSCKWELLELGNRATDDEAGFLLIVGFAVGGLEDWNLQDWLWIHGRDRIIRLGGAPGR